MRKYRKQEHIENYLRTKFTGNPRFCDVFLKHNSLPNLAVEDVRTEIEFLGKDIEFPLMINAMTGGSDFSEEINRDLAELAKACHLPMAVGSQTIAIEDHQARRSFRIVREILKDGIVYSNINGLLGPEEAKIAVDLIEADALQIHLNPAQELIMKEGDRDFTKVLSNIEAIVNAIDVPVIVKEVGFGMSKDVIQKLYDVGVRCVDISGFGGTNFFEVENLRYPQEDYSELFTWGIPTALCIIEGKSLQYDDLVLVASGGIRNAEDLVKSIILGADMTGISGELLKYLIHGGYDHGRDYLENIKLKTKILMLLLGAKNIKELKNIPYLLKGELKDLVEQKNEGR
ncbi:MAG: type 2 isopentenyl-diphosphate Delta-isomerase [Tissierellia bacterium]|nr:type 2 isopentenyl-diphosphate Delta-isomerase [Tissierellia bacterium]